MAVKVKLKGPTKSLKSILGGGDQGDGKDTLHGVANAETVKKVTQDQRGFNSPSKGAVLVKRQGAKTTPTRTGPSPGSKAATPFPPPGKRSQVPDDNGARDGRRTPSIAIILGGASSPSLTPVNASRSQRQYLRSGQPSSGE